MKIISEIRRYSELAYFSQNPQVIRRFNSRNYRPYLQFGIHLGWAIEGAIGSADHKIDACYISPHKTVADRILGLCGYYDMQILITESVYNLMSLKARNTLRKIDVIRMNEHKEPRGIYTFDMSFEGNCHELGTKFYK